MTPKEQNLISTLNLLVLLRRSKKLVFPALTEELQNTLQVTREHLAIAQITTPVFINTLNILGEKGYLFAVSVFENKFHDKIQNDLTDENISKLKEQIKSVDTSKLSQELRERVADVFKDVLPPNMTIDRKALLADTDINFPDMVSDAMETMKVYSKEDVSVVYVLPFRDIERLLEKMNSGAKFDEVQDAGTWYDPNKYEFHFGDETESTAYRGSATKTHEVLKALFHNPTESVIDYSDVPEFNHTHAKTKENKAYSDAIRGFVSKNPKLSKIFKVYSDRLEIQEKYRDDTH